ncbi:MAG: hypothetical protein HZY76_23410 [Anaerolineae bacterium]|nr:MAG: hypothetical protein HZY76_23410 [Anaerolineae bacterium]
MSCGWSRGWPPCAEGQPVDRLVVSYYATLDAASVMADLQARGVVIEAQRDYSRQLDIAIDPARLEEIIALPYLQFLGPEPEEPVLEPYDYRNASGRANYLNTDYNGLNYNGAGWSWGSARAARWTTWSMWKAG